MIQIIFCALTQPLNVWCVPYHSKWHLGFFAPEYVPTARGFDTFVGFYGGEEDYFSKNFTENGYNGYDFRNGTRVIENYEYSTHIYGILSCTFSLDKM